MEKRGFMYLVAIMDWFSRYILSWKLSNTMDTHFCLEALEAALNNGKPIIFNSDQGSQFTSLEFIRRLETDNIAISMDSKGRALDNIFIERLWRSVKYEDIYIKDYENGYELESGLHQYFELYNNQRPHQSLEYKTPACIYFEKEVR
jgi:putative transposase